MNVAGTPLSFLNGRRTTGEAHLSVLDRGFTLSDALFETMRLYEGRIFRLPQHLARLAAGARTLDIPLPAQLPSWVDATLEAAHAADIRSASVRLTVSRGPAPPGLQPPSDPHPTVAIVIGPLGPRSSELDQGLHVHVASGRRNEFSPTAGIKTTAYADSLLALAAARARGAHDAIVLDTSGHVSEATARNGFLVRDGRLVTPPPECGALPGITRAAVIELATALGVGCDVRTVERAELYDAEEMFLTSSVRELVPVTRIDGLAVGRGRPGPLTERLLSQFADLVRRECSC